MTLEEYIKISEALNKAKVEIEESFDEFMVVLKDLTSKQ